MKPFLAVGDAVINPADRVRPRFGGDPEVPKLRLVFAGPGSNGPGRGELSLVGEDAKAALRWLRLNSAFANGTAAFGSASSPLHWGESSSSDRPNLRESDGIRQRGSPCPGEGGPLRPAMHPSRLVREGRSACAVGRQHDPDRPPAGNRKAHVHPTGLDAFSELIIIAIREITGIAQSPTSTVRRHSILPFSDN